jgi:branched-chain amino acid transport system ATP-binding protein
MSPVIVCKNLRRDFLGFTAVEDFNLEVSQGAIHALIGPNGAGKTTVFNLLTRFLPVTSGHIFLNGEDITLRTAEQVVGLGMVRSFQISAVFARLSALDNIRTALMARSGGVWNFWSSHSKLDCYTDEAKQYLDMFDLTPFSNVQAASLPYGVKRALELATTLSCQPKVLLLDEPTQGMGVEDIARITDLILKAAEGRTVIMVEHNLKVVECLADRITVLAQGRKLAEGSYSQVSEDPKVREAYLGKVVESTRSSEDWITA